MKRSDETGHDEIDAGNSEHGLPEIRSLASQEQLGRLEFPRWISPLFDIEYHGLWRTSLGDGILGRHQGF